jgi:hypothetical protein|tara:strand:- start:97 stop:393 length:297 start_codon:yes stop_codon:yes gene_type:complete
MSIERDIAKQEDMKSTMKAAIGAVLGVAILFVMFWSFMLQKQINDMQESMEEWSQHIAQRVADAENKANLKYEADMQTLEMMFDLIYKLKQMEEQDAE